MDTKIQTLKAAAAAGEWQKAIAIAARFPRLGEHKAAIERAHMAYTNPRFLAQLGRDADTCKADGRAALVARYKLAG